MNKKIHSGIMLTLLLIGMLTWAFGIQPVKSDWTWTETIYIRTDGSVDPNTAPISTFDNITYTLTDNIVGDVPYDSEAIVVQRDNILIDGAGFTLEGAGVVDSKGMDLSGRSNVTIKNIEIKGFWCGFWLYESSNHNTIAENNITNNNWDGIRLTSSSTNTFYHNHFINNTQQVYISGSGYPNYWDDGYPSGGNYWSDYVARYPDAEELDDSSIWDTPYVIDETNQDNYPLMEPWTSTPPIPTTINELKTEIEELGSEGKIDNGGIVKSLIAKLNVAQKLVDKGKIDEAKSILEEDFIPQVENQSDIHITPEAADILIGSAEYIISHP